MADLTKIIKYQRSMKGKGAISALGTAIKQKTAEKIDPRNYIFSDEGFMTAMFPGLRGYKAKTRIHTPEEKRIVKLNENTAQVNSQLIQVNKTLRSINSTLKGIYTISRKLIKSVDKKNITPRNNLFSSQELKENELESKNNTSPTQNTSNTSPEKPEEKGLSLLSKVGIGLLGTGFLSLLTEFFASDDFKNKVGNVIKTVGKSIFEEKTWDELKEKVETGAGKVKNVIEATFENILKSLKDLITENLDKIIGGLTALYAVLHPFKTASTIGMVASFLATPEGAIFIAAIATAVAGAYAGQKFAKYLPTKEDGTVESSSIVEGALDWGDQTKEQKAEKRLDNEIIMQDLNKRMAEMSRNADINPLPINENSSGRVKGRQKMAELWDDLYEAKGLGRHGVWDTSPERVQGIPKNYFNSVYNSDQEGTTSKFNMNTQKFEPVKNLEMPQSMFEKSETPTEKLLKGIGNILSPNEAKAEEIPTSPTKANPSNPSEFAYQYFLNKGWKPHEAAGIVGNLSVESHFNTIAHNEKEDARGIAQWRGDRLKKFKEEIGKDVFDASLEEQLKFVDWELKNSHKEAGDLLRKSSSASDAAAIVDAKYEKSAGSARGLRMATAEEISKGNFSKEPSKSDSELYTMSNALSGLSGSRMANVEQTNKAMKALEGNFLNQGSVDFESILRDIAGKPPVVKVNVPKDNQRTSMNQQSKSKTEVYDMDLIPKLIDAGYLV